MDHHFFSIHRDETLPPWSQLVQEVVDMFPGPILVLPSRGRGVQRLDIDTEIGIGPEGPRG